MSPVTILKAVRVLIANPENWTQRAFARDANGNRVLADDPDAVCWCLRGAILHVAPDLDDRCKTYEVLSKYLGSTDRAFIVFNDTHDHETVMSVLDQAIAGTSS